MSQPRSRSFLEACMNILIGYSINFIMNAIFLPLFVEGFTVKDNLALGAIYTAISLVRSYCIRRWFNREE